MSAGEQFSGTGTGFLFRAMKPEFCLPGALSHHCFALDLAASGGAWLDAPYWIPAGSTIKAERAGMARPMIFSRAAWRDGGCL